MHELDEQLRELIPRLRRFALSLSRNASSADDLAIDPERAITRWADKTVDGDLRAWLFSILYRQFSMPIGGAPALCACSSSSPAATMCSRRSNAR